MDQYQLARFPVDIFSALNKTCADNAPCKKIDFFFMSFFAPGAPTGAMCWDKRPEAAEESNQRTVARISEASQKNGEAPQEAHEGASLCVQS